MTLKSVIRKLMQHIPIAALGGLLYMGVELLWRGHTHWTMGVLGGVCFAAIGLLDETWPDMPVCNQAILGALIVTAAELVVGLIVNVWLGWGVWDYSTMPLNIIGQVCLPYTLLWVLLSAIAIVIENLIHLVIDRLF